MRWSENEGGIDEFRLVLDDDRVEQIFAGLGLLRRHHRADGERTQGIRYRQCTFRGILATGKRKHIRPALTLTIDVHTTHLIDQRIYQRADLTGIGAEDAYLLAVIRGNHVFERVLDVYERHHGNDRAKLLLTVKLHPLADGIDHRRVEQRHGERAAALVDDTRALGSCVFDCVRHVRGPMQARQWRDCDALLPWHADLELGKLLDEAMKEQLCNRLVHNQHLERGAALSVERKRAKQ